MKYEAYQINRIVGSVAALEAVRTVRITIIILLGIEFFVRYFHRYAITSLIFLVLLAAGPFMISQVLRRDKTKEQSRLMPMLCKRHRYSHKELKALLVVFVLCPLCFSMQLYGNLQSTITEWYIIYMPVLYIFLTTIGTVGLYLYNRKKIGKVLENNRL